ncbi:MAG: ABC transporter permease [Candidatus Taylorbacteria bacterium]|nr:ABC transporter permease [Candidatus Taylorbacteria bacterium]
MIVRHQFGTALKALKRHRSRTLLTILGIVIGITAIILVMSLGQGTQDLILSQIQGMGSKTIAVAPGRQPTGPSDAAQIFSDSLKEKDLTALKNKSNVPNLKAIMPVVFGGESSAFESETYRLTFFGATELMSSIFDLTPEIGEFINEDDVRGRADVVVLGYKVKSELFGDTNALGQKIRIKNRNFRVIGVLPRKGQVSFFNFDEIAIVPYTTAQQYILGIKYFHRLIIEADEDRNIDRTVRDIKATLRDSHNITDPEKDDFFVETQADLADRLGLITTILTVFLSGVAGISLLVGGVGIMNIMFVSVTERTREIGLRKALGATNRDILTQFLVEAVILTSIGGAVGILLGSGLGALISVILSKTVVASWSFSFPYLGAILGLGVSATIGLVFGIFPAREAARKSPMEALRYE